MGPIAHTGIGFLGFKLSDSKENKRILLYLFLMANLPDIDFLFSLIFTKAKSIHQLYTHNIFFVGITTGLLLLIVKSLRSRWKIFLLVAYSHLLLDLFVVDPIPPLGIKLFFPIIDKPLNFGFFPNLWRNGFKEIFSLHNFFVFFLEYVIFILPVWLLMKGKNSKKKRRKKS